MYINIYREIKEINIIFASVVSRALILHFDIEVLDILCNITIRKNIN